MKASTAADDVEQLQLVLLIVEIGFGKNPLDAGFDPDACSLKAPEKRGKGDDTALVVSCLPVCLGHIGQA